MVLKEDKAEALHKGQKGTVRKALVAEDWFCPRGYFPWGRLSDTVPRALSWGLFEELHRSVADSHQQQRLSHHCTPIKSQSVCLLPMLAAFGPSCQLRVEMCPPHSKLLFMFPSGQRPFADLSIIHFAASIAVLPCLPPRVYMQIRPKLTSFLNSASLAWGKHFLHDGPEPAPVCCQFHYRSDIFLCVQKGDKNMQFKLHASPLNLK